MLKKIMMILVPVIALVAGSLGGEMMRPGPGTDAPGETDQGTSHGASDDGEHAAAAETAHAAPAASHGSGGHGSADPAAAAWFTFPRQFFVPLTRNGDMGALMILTLSLETTEGAMPDLEAQEHRLRDALLRQLLIAANTGGFDGNFTSEAKLRPLREDLLKAVKEATNAGISAVLIEDIARQGG